MHMYLMEAYQIEYQPAALAVRLVINRSVGRMIVMSTCGSTDPGFDSQPRETKDVGIDIRSSAAWHSV